MIFNPTITTEALRMAVALYTEEMRLAIAYVDAGEQVNIQTAQQHFRRAEAAHFIVGLLFDAAQMQDDLKPADEGTPIRVEEGSSKLPPVPVDEAQTIDPRGTWRASAPEALPVAEDDDDDDLPAEAYLNPQDDPAITTGLPGEDR